MSGKKASIAQVMMVVALAAVNLAVARAAPEGVVEYPSLWVAMGSLDFLIVRKLIQRRPFQAFHFTLLIVLIVTFFVMAIFVANRSFHPLALLVRFYQHVSGNETNRIWRAGYAWLGEFWAIAFLSLALACAAGSVAAWLERRLGWDIAAFWRGALVGLSVAAILAIAFDAARASWGHPEPGEYLVARLAVIGTCVISGGMMGLRWMRSSTLR